MKILVVGKGGREHALVQALADSPTACELYAFPGSDAMGDQATCVSLSGLSELGEFLRSEGIELCVAGEESFLVREEGLAAVCREAGVPCWGPPKETAQLEASKVFAKQFLERHGIPTAKFQLARSVEEARQAIREYPVVLKFDGLAAGKGVAVCRDGEHAEHFLHQVLEERKFGEGDLLIEECLQGPEVSIFAAVSDGACQIFAPARDYKRIGEGDVGANTGGMGAVACRSGLLEPGLLASIKERIVGPTIRGMEEDGLPYRGFLYFGLMLTSSGPQVLEYNCRFGDPEAQAVLPLVSGDFVRYLESAARGSLDPGLIRFSEDWSVCVVLASRGYPESSNAGDVIAGLDELTGARIYHGGTRRGSSGKYETNGGRVLAVVAQGSSRAEAVKRVYENAGRIRFEGRQMRRDIGILHFDETPESPARSSGSS